MDFSAFFKPFFMASACVAVCATGTFAAPADPTPYSYDNHGDSVTLQRFGDEHYSLVQTVDGYLVVSDTAGVYYYADENGLASKFKAKNDLDRNAQEKAYLKKLDKDASFKAHRKNHPDRFVRPREHGSNRRASWVPSGDVSSSSEGDGVPPHLRLPKAGNHANGTNRFPIILVTTQGGKSYLDSAGFSQMLNETGYNTNNYTGSVRDYFVDQSSGKFVPIFDVYTVSVSNPLSSYDSDENEYKLVTDAVSALGNKYSGFSAAPYDADNDGFVDAVGVFYSGTDGVGGYHYDLKWDGVKDFSVGGKKFGDYFLLSQGSHPYPSFIHEFSHSLGLKDHYCVRSKSCYNNYNDSLYQAPGAHAWDVMGTGMYNNGGKTPPNYSAFERNFMGWLEYDTLTSSDQVTVVKDLGSSNKAYKIPVPGYNDEWFILENRQFVKWDSKLPNHGMLIWHIDYNSTAWTYDTLNDVPSHQRVDIVEAGNLKVTGYYDGQSATHLKDDPFPGSQNITSFSGFKSWAGKDLGIKLYSITEEDSNICFATQQGVVVTTCAVAASSSSVATSSNSVATSSSSVAASSNSVAAFSSSNVPGSSAALALRQSSVESQALITTRGTFLDVTSNILGVKKVEIFDVQGHLVYKALFYGSRFGIDLSRFTHLGVAVVRVSGPRQILGTKKVNLRF